MRRSTIQTILFGMAVLLGSHSIAAEESNSPSQARRILYNLDGCSCIFYKKNVYAPCAITTADLRAIVDELTQPGGYPAGVR